MRSYDIVALEPSHSCAVAKTKWAIIPRWWGQPASGSRPIRGRRFVRAGCALHLLIRGGAAISLAYNCFDSSWSSTGLWFHCCGGIGDLTVGLIGPLELTHTQLLLLWVGAVLVCVVCLLQVSVRLLMLDFCCTKVWDVSCGNWRGQHTIARYLQEILEYSR